MIKDDVYVSNGNINCRSLILSNEDFTNKSKNKKKNVKKRWGTQHVTHSDKNENNYSSEK